MNLPTVTAQRVKVANWSELEDRKPSYALVGNVDLVVIRYDDKVSVLYGRCLHRGALLADGHIRGESLICGVHNWDYRYDTGVSEYSNEEVLHKFTSWIDLAEGRAHQSLREGGPVVRTAWTAVDEDDRGAGSLVDHVHSDPR